MSNKRWFYAACGIISLLFLGLIYAWSVFTRPLEQEFGWNRSETSLTFSISLFAFCLGSLGSGFIAKKVSPRIIMVASSFLILTGFCMASFIVSLRGLYVFYSIFCGFGVGMGYNSTLNSILKWFPDKQGIVSGILLMGFGFGGSLLGSLAVYMMIQFGWRITFRVLGAALSFFIILSSFLIKKPSPEELSEIKSRVNKKGALKPVESEDIPASKMIRERSFWGYVLWAALLSSAGLSIIGNAASMSGFFTKNIVEAAFVAGLVNTANGIGRLSFGFLFDIIGSRRSFYIITGGLICSMLILIAAFSTGSFIILGIGFVITGLSYGGITPCNSAYTGKIFGQKYYPGNFSIVNVTLLVAAFLGPYCAGLIQTKHGSYITMILVLVFYCIISVPVSLLINKHSVVQKSSS